MAADERLKWERDGAGLRAPVENGEATIVHDTATGRRRWFVRVGKATASDIAANAQHASDRANEVLPMLKTMAAQIEAAEAHKAAVLAQIDRITTEADPDVSSIFGIAAADKENLSWLMDQVRHRRRTPGISKLIDALSRELYKFRTGKR
jgi:hypothetical protein